MHHWHKLTNVPPWKLSTEYLHRLSVEPVPLIQDVQLRLYV